MDNDDYKIVLEKSTEGSAELVLEGDLSMDYSMQVYDELISLSNNSEFDIIRIKKIKNVHLSLIQILISLKESLRKKNREIEIICDFEGEFSELLENAGIANLLQSISKSEAE
ncbi:MAG: hypothetical protein U9R19_09535 [Bacteroidota bacterium]|nr:hypothetical protein [Bacteroidota bacterium]